MTKETNAEQRVQERNFRRRLAIGEAMTALRGQQSIQTFQAFTFEEAMDLQIERIEGQGTMLRPNLLTRVDRIEQTLVRTVADLRSTPEEDTLVPDPLKDVNTP